MRPFAILFALAISACGAQAQYSSGAQYLQGQRSSLASYQEQTLGTQVGPAAAEYAASRTAPTPTDALIAKAAGIEPTLQFPARIGLARIMGGAITPIPQDEANLWIEALSRNAQYGEFVPISPLIADMTASAIRAKRGHGRGAVIETVRLGAARQHVDAVLIYEVGVRGAKENTALAFADLTIIGGAFLPTRSVNASAVATALLVDVRNGYPYGTADAQREISRFSQSWGSDAAFERARREVGIAAVDALVPEVEAMFGMLSQEMRLAGR